MKKKIILILFIILSVIYIFDIYKEFNNYGARAAEKMCSRTDLSDYAIEWCENVKKVADEKYEHPSEDTNTYMYLILNLTKCNIIYVYVLLILYASQCEVQDEKSAIRNTLTRMDYKKYMKKRLLKTYKYTFIFPLLILIFYIAAFLLSGHFDPSYILDGLKESPVVTFEPVYLKMGPLLIIYLIVLTELYACFFANLGTICSFKSKNIFITVISGFLLFLGINILIEFSVLSVAKMFNLANIPLWKYNFINIFILDSKSGTPLYNLLKPLVLFITSLIVILVIYKNKEKTIIEWEK